MSLSRFAATVVVVAFAALAGCGFQLRGVGEFPESLATTYVDTADRYTVFYQELLAELRRGGVTIVDSPVDASSVIRLELDATGQRVLTISGRNVPTEFDVFYNLVYSVWTNGEEVLAAQELALNQSYTYDQTTVLGKNREEQEIRNSLALNLVQQVARQLSLLK
jgi:LPS-assembly lipoprotein